MIEFLFRSAAPPEVVLAAIREDLREWRESTIPRPLWAGGVLQVVGTVRPPAFRLRYDRRWQRGRGGDPLELRGTALPAPGGGTLVRGVCGETAGRWWATAAFGGVGVWITVSTGLGAAAPAFGLAAVFALVDWWRSRPGTGAGDPEARYLIERVEGAVQRAGAAPGLGGGQAATTPPSAT